MSAFLGVEQSATGRRWVGPSADQDRLTQALAQQSGLPEAVASVLVQRSVSEQDAQGFLNPTLRDLMPDPSSMRDMDQAAERFNAAITGHEKIAIFADYDVDGAGSAALLINWIAQIMPQAAPTLYIPDRITEGYGPNTPAMEQLAADHDLIICVDCGTLSHEPIKAAKAADVIVLDHHLGGETLPDALAVVNPNRQDETHELGYLCAAGVVFMLLVAVNRVRRNQGQQLPDLMSLLDLVALATVADVAPLKGLNRAFVRQGLAVMAGRTRVGLTALSDVARMDAAPSAYHLGFLLGPRINAGGRIGKADLGTRLLSTSDPHEAASIADKLDQLNTERRDIEEQLRLKAMAQIEERPMDGPLVWAAGDGWHPGVMGIVAARLKEATNRPAVVMGFDGDEGKGSARSVNGVDLGSAIQRLASEGLIEKGGGHKMAAGLSLSKPQLEPAMERLGELLARQGADKMGPADLRLDGLLMPRAATVELIGEIEQAGPFGAGAPAPRFAFPAQRVAFAKRAGENHLRLTFEGDQGDRIDAIAFRAFDSELGSMLERHNGQRFHIAGRLEIDSFTGRNRPKLRLEDVSPAE